MKNVGSIDKTIRLVAGFALGAFSFLQLGGLASTAGIVALVVGAVLVVTGVVNFCPAYRLLGLRTNSANN